MGGSKLLSCQIHCDYSKSIVYLMGKKNLTKSAEQRLRLEGFFERRQSSWQREEIMAISRAAGLTRQQVYKWLWDRKRQERQKIKLESQEEPFYPPAESRWVRYERYRIQVPVDKQQATVYFVHPSVSVWAMLVLRSEGWQLVRDAQNRTSNPPRPQYPCPHISCSCRLPAVTYHPRQRGPKYSMEKRMEEEIFESEP